MKLAVSNIAWPADQRQAAYALLRENGIGGLEIAPGLLFSGASDPFLPTEAEVEAALGPVRSAGLTLVSMQSLLFGAQGVALFGTAEERARLEAAMLRAIHLATLCGIPNLVFGSPGQRVIPQGMSAEEATQSAAAFFRSLGDRATGCRIAIEPNPAAYGTNFLTTMEEALAFVERVNHPAITLNFDIGALHMNGHFDQLEALAERAAPVISHVHFSEPNLGPAPASADQAARVFAILRRIGYEGWCSIEMKTQPDAPLAAVAGGIGRLLSAAGERVA